MMIRKNGRELGLAIGFSLVACIGGKKGDSWRGAVHPLEKVGDEVGFVGVVECCNREFELVGELKSLRTRRCGDRSYSDHTIKLNCFVAVVVDFGVSP